MIVVVDGTGSFLDFQLESRKGKEREFRLVCGRSGQNGEFHKKWGDEKRYGHRSEDQDRLSGS